MTEIDPRREERRQQYIERLYMLSDRSNGLFTGLYQERVNALVEQDMDFLEDLLHDAIIEAE